MVINGEWREMVRAVKNGRVVICGELREIGGGEGGGRYRRVVISGECRGMGRRREW